MAHSKTPHITRYRTFVFFGSVTGYGNADLLRTTTNKCHHIHHTMYYIHSNMYFPVRRRLSCSSIVTDDKIPCKRNDGFCKRNQSGKTYQGKINHSPQADVHAKREEFKYTDPLKNTSSIHGRIGWYCLLTLVG